MSATGHARRVATAPCPRFIPSSALTAGDDRPTRHRLSSITNTGCASGVAHRPHQRLRLAGRHHPAARRRLPVGQSGLRGVAGRDVGAVGHQQQHTPRAPLAGARGIVLVRPAVRLIARLRPGPFRGVIGRTRGNAGAAQSIAMLAQGGSGHERAREHVVGSDIVEAFRLGRSRSWKASTRIRPRVAHAHHR